MNLKPIFITGEIIKAIRQFFDKEGFHEVITPVLNRSLPLEPNIYPFSTCWNRVNNNQIFYLATSPEAELKKMLARGIGNCFAFSKSFRDLEGSGPDHSPEFLMLEWYRGNSDYLQIMNDTKKLLLFIKKRIDKYNGHKSTQKIKYQNISVSLGGEWSRLSLITLFHKYAKLDLNKIIIDKELLKAAKEKSYDTNNSTWEQLFNQIFLNEIEPELPLTPLFLSDFPARISPLCAPQKDNPNFAERFEFYMFGKELGNGNTENTDSREVLDNFKNEEKKRIKSIQPFAPIDHEFIEALNKMNGKKYAGMGLGVDRLVMIFSNVSTIISNPGSD